MAVRACEQKSCDLSELPIAALQEFSPLIDEEVYSVLTLEGSVAARHHLGGTAPAQVSEAIKIARARLK